MPAAVALEGVVKSFGKLQVSVQEPAGYAGLLSRLTESGAVVQKVGGPVLAASLKGVDPASIPSDRGELDAPAVLLLHGFPEDRQSWDAIADHTLASVDAVRAGADLPDPPELKLPAIPGFLAR